MSQPQLQPQPHDQAIAVPFPVPVPAAIPISAPAASHCQRQSSQTPSRYHNTDNSDKALSKRKRKFTSDPITTWSPVASSASPRLHQQMNPVRKMEKSEILIRLQCPRLILPLHGKALIRNSYYYGCIIPIRPNGETIIDERRVLSPFLITSALTLDQVILMAVEGDDEESSGYACVVESDTAILVHTTRNSWGDTELFSSVRLIPKPTSALPGSRAIQQEL
ncbi:hypothetical protein WG66_008856 [Moniliophthora roreri]|nr:hypothetical protein WG66_008856 [Moniliophthora roreri]